MDLGKGFSAALQNNKGLQVFSWVIAVLGLVFGCFSVSIVPFLRKDFGERYLGWINLFFGYTIVAIFTFLGNAAGVASGHRFSWVIVLFWLAFVATSLYHRVQIWRKNKAGVEWHTMCMGESLLPLPFSQETIFKIIEPALVFIAGLLLWRISGQVGIWLMIGGVSLLFTNHIAYYQEREEILNIRDAYIEAKNRGKAFAGRPATETGGYVVAASTIHLVRHDEGLRKAFAGLSSDMLQLFDAQPGFSGTAA